MRFGIAADMAPSIGIVGVVCIAPLAQAREQMALDAPDLVHLWVGTVAVQCGDIVSGHRGGELEQLCGMQRRTVDGPGQGDGVTCASIIKSPLRGMN